MVATFPLNIALFIILVTSTSSVPIAGRLTKHELADIEILNEEIRNPNAKIGDHPHSPFSGANRAGPILGENRLKIAGEIPQPSKKLKEAYKKMKKKQKSDGTITSFKTVDPEAWYHHGDKDKTDAAFPLSRITKTESTTDDPVPVAVEQRHGAVHVPWKDYFPVLKEETPAMETSGRLVQSDNVLEHSSGDIFYSATE
ncbi:hypothetical protein FRB97_003734, partial [Tulasnella sp. 331]